MSLRAMIGLVLMWVVSLVAVAAIVTAQARETVPLPTPTILTGSEVGFRVEGMQGQRPVGRFVVRLEGQWVEAVFGGKPLPVR